MRIVSVLTGCLLFGAVAAQDPVAQQPSAEERMAELQKMQQAAVQKWREARQKQKANADGSVKAISMRPDFGPIATKALAYAADYAGTDDAVDFLMMAMNMDQSKAPEVLETLIDKHVDSDKLAAMGRMMPYLGRIVDQAIAEKALARLVQSKSLPVRGWAMLASFSETIASGDRDGDAYKDARAKLLAVADEVDDDRLATTIRDAITERETFGAGCDAPDIAGVDLDGVDFKLSDYKGKVIFLDFWGDW